MKVSSFLITSGLLISLFSTHAIAEEVTPAETKLDEQSIKKIVHDYLIKNPEVLVEASQALQEKQQKTMQEQAKTAVKKIGDQFFQENITYPANAGSRKGDVTVVEFFDYQCQYCKNMSEIMDAVIKNNPSIRVIYKDLPIFGKNSELASKAALAAAKQGKYLPMHHALFNLTKHLDEKIILETAQTLGLNMQKLKEDMKDEKHSIQNILDSNRQLAEKLKLIGTPAFVIAETPNGKFTTGKISFIPGATTKDAIEKLIKETISKS